MSDGFSVFHQVDEYNPLSPELPALRHCTAEEEYRVMLHGVS